MISALISPPNKRVFAVLDVGTTKILALIVRIMSDGEIVVLGKGHIQSNGIRCGAIMNVREANECIMEAVQEAEKEAKESVDQIYVNVADCGVKSQIFTVTNNVGNRQIHTKDISKIIHLATREIIPPYIAVHSIPTSYTLDKIEGISSPINMYGTELVSRVNVVTVLKSALLNLEHCLNQCSLNLRGCSVSAYSTGISSLTMDEQHVGSAIIDIGGGSTAIGIFKNKNNIYTDCIPIGGGHITYDIACAFNLRLSTAERVKNLYGSAVVTSSEVSDFAEIGGDDPEEPLRRIPLSTLSTVIRPRLEEIFELVKHKISKFSTNTVVISGGTSQLPNTRELALSILEQDVRIGDCKNIAGLSQETSQGAFAAAKGLAILVCKHRHDNLGDNNYDKGIRKILKLWKHKLPISIT